MEGDLNGKRGLFPDNFVKEIKKESKEGKEAKSEPKEESSSQAPRREKTSGNVASLVQRISTIGIPTGGFQPLPPGAAKSKMRKRQCKAIFQYQPVNEDELELTIGDIIDITEEVEEGWWSGTLNNKSGLFPSNFVKELDGTDDGESNDTAAAETNGSGMESAGTPTSPQPSSGNGVITQPKKVRGVGFGDIFREGSVTLKARLPSPETEEKKEKPIPSLPSAAKPTPLNSTDSQKAEGDGKSKVKEYCKVTFTFEATNEDELTVREGDVIHILTKDTGEPGWWRGEIGGQEGVFPDNFVIMLEGEKEAPSSRGSLKSSARQESEEKPKKPPPPSKSIALKPDVPSADKKPHSSRPEDRVDRPNHKPAKPAAPLVPPKKPVPPPGRARPGVLPPQRPTKPSVPSPISKQNGEVSSTRPKSDLEPVVPTKPKALSGSGEWVERNPDTDLMSFEELSSPIEKLSHLTTDRPKMLGRRLPAKFVGQSPNKELSVEMSFKVDEEDSAKPKLTEARKPSTNPFIPSPLFHKPPVASAEFSPSPLATTVSDGPPLGAKAQPNSEEPTSQLEELRSQMKDLLLSVELLKTQQMREIAELRGQLDEERLKRVALQMEIEKLKRAVQST
ncbi:CD2-associated protein [Brachionichthys hirsutus]|uniref:CD2-associated protein n=1 Tax=Brachionichthys hirsutus TaxID=412623 RepID=UPI003604D00C